MVFDDKFVYSFHESDPACGKELNAFDLVRVHKYPSDDEKKSFKEMADFASKDEKVKLLILQEKQKNAQADFATDDDSWKKYLEYESRSTVLKNNLHNITLIMENDSNLRSIVLNQLADGMEIKGVVPWKHPAKFWRDADDAQLISYIDSNYGTFSERNYRIAVTKVSDDRSYHPIKEMFESLPPWDGVKRAETILIDYLGADDNDYVRAVTRKALCAAYMRVYNPGIKFDTMIVLNGAQGIGKSTLISLLGMDWFSDSLTLSDMNDKTAAEKLQGYWILEIGELAGMKKADLDKVKAFISRQDDKYRASFGRRVTPHPRQCVFFGTTNSENGYLRDITGNRRFWNVKVNGDGKYKPWELDSKTIKQIWAEVVQIAESGEKLYLDPKLETYAKQDQRKAMEHDEREGLVREYLEILLPDNWDSPCCKTPHITEDEIKARVLKVYNGLISDKEPFIKACKLTRDVLTDTKEIDREMSELLREFEVVTELIKKCIAENSSSAQDQEKYTERYNSYVDRYDKAKSRYDELKQKRENKLSKRKAIDCFIYDLSKRDELLTEFDNCLWLTVADKVTVRKDVTLVFKFNDGTEIKG